MAAKVSQRKRTLGVVTPAEAVAEAGADGDDVLEGTAQRDTGDIVDHADAEVLGVKELDIGQGKFALVGAVADGGLRELVAGDCCERKNNVPSLAMLAPLRAAQGMPRASWMTSAKMLILLSRTSTPLIMEMAWALGEMLPLSDLQILRMNCRVSFLHAATTYLVRQHEDQKSRVARGLLDVRDGNNVLGELHVGEVLLVGVLLVDDVRQVLTVDLQVSIPLRARSTYLLLVDIHVHLALERVRVARSVVACRSASRIPTGYACTYPQSWQWRYPCAVLAACSLALDVPVARADNGDLLLLDSHDVGRGAMDS